MNKSKVITGILIGVAAGAAIYSLYGTKKGAKLRKKISAKSGDISDIVMSKFNELGETLKNKYSKVKTEGQELYEKGKKRAEQVHDAKFSM